MIAKWTVQREDSGQSLLSFLKSKISPEMSVKAIKRSLDAGYCMLNRQVERFGSRLVGLGDQIYFELSASVCPKKSSNSILYVDDQILSLDKRPGIASDSGDLLKSLQKEFGAVKLLHRLDKETSGILLFARSNEIAKEIERLFKERKVSKTYLALVDGNMQRASGTVDNYLGKLKVYQGQTLWGEVPKQEGLRAVTHWEVIRQGKTVSFLSCTPETGRTHQIRVHLSGLKHPILGDYQYGRGFKCPYKPERLLLHASELSFLHPGTSKKITIKAEIPEDFMSAIRKTIDKNG